MMFNGIKHIDEIFTQITFNKFTFAVKNFDKLFSFVF